MVPISGSKLRGPPTDLSDALLAHMIGAALQADLGGTRQATKTVMRWTHVSDHTARSWLNGHTSPSSLHLLELATQSQTVMAVILKATGYGGLELAHDLAVVENALEEALARVKALRDA
ncbi:hypothetical protein [Erythrobacter sp.]|uniref:hypothetical protein n=1 Tax=Erythrobacter sp. TaxID=1042 RepID=UPI0025E8DBF1|nr:hypothetical protein [Erythrobacter sp.]